MERAWAVRPLVAGDRESVLAIARALPEWFNAQGLKEIARDLPLQHGWVAIEDTRVVGWLLWAARGEQAADLTWVGVAKDAHRRGVGSALVESLAEHLQGLGVAELFVSTVADSVDDEPYARTRAFYRAVGFEDFRVDKGHFPDPRGDYDRLLLRRELAGDPPGPTK